MIATATFPLGPKWVHHKGRYYELDRHLPLDHMGRVSLIHLADRSRGVGVDPTDVYPASPEQADACEWWRDQIATGQVTLKLPT